MAISYDDHIVAPTCRVAACLPLIGPVRLAFDLQVLQDSQHRSCTGCGDAVDPDILLAVYFGLHIQRSFSIDNRLEVASCHGREGQKPGAR